MTVAFRSEDIARHRAVLVFDSAPPAADLLRDASSCRVDYANSLTQAEDLLDLRAYELVLCASTLPVETRRTFLARLSEDHPATRCMFLPQNVAPSQVLQQALGLREARPSLKASGVLTSTIRALVAAMDSRDPNNRAHSMRVTQLAVELGRAMALPEEELEILELAALLHDVGKIAVPEQILAKPGPLDDAEWSLVKQHPEYSADIVRQVASLTEVAMVVRHHHERVDGTGYPDGLAGNSIPLLSQLISIVDAYEAMTADRCYRQAMDASDARRIIREGLGTQFDPELGRVFLGLPSLH